ncbi:hypothetical protein [Chryseolinea lacunae]|uniref:DUF4421 domain-containing protein n=1 Tax=Chryseolinea lacunae TaxID=2801331 RepID=A0ABS1KLA9_9BACT|nr:hypothetical protein [Chryseolinea lacunae]MBL0740123.1 hypothetical protein [Chryseolinea lacunae]
MNHRFLILIAALLTASVNLFAQGERKDKTAVTYEELYDEPYSVNKLFVGIQPLYAEMFVTNVNAGFGAEAVYYHKDKADFRVSFRKTYSQQFFDFSRDLAMKKSDVDNRAEVFNYYEFGGTYHIKDFEQSSKTKMFLYKNSYKGNKWAARVPLNAEVPCKVRKIYGARLGAIIWDSSTDMGRALSKQGLSNADFKNAEGIGLPKTIVVNGRSESFDVFSNISSQSLYIGGSMAWIKNVAVNFDKFEEGIDDLIFTVYADIMYAPSLKIDNIVYTDPDENSPNAGTHTYDVSPLKTKNIGFRLGMDGRFNRMFSWSYGAELGYRPSIQGRGLYAMLKISFPVFGTNLDYKVESFGK